MKTNDTPITDLMKDIKDGKIQLPDFQRSWVWDDNRIKSLIASITSGFPVGAAMFLEYGNDNVRFRYRCFESVNAPSTILPTELVLDGQQRLTSIYTSMYGKAPVRTKTDKGDEIFRYYYIDIEKAIDPSCDRIEAIISMPENKKITSNFGRDIDLDLSNREKEFEKKMFPINIILDYTEIQTWQNDYYAYCKYNTDAIQKFMKFNTEIVLMVMRYAMPVIRLEKETPKEAVCQVFENVNTGGVSLTVFELITAMFAMDDFQLREDWENKKRKYFSGDLLKIITSTDLLTACTLLTSYKKGGTVSCKKKDVLNLTLSEYKQYADELCEGFAEAEKLLEEERIFASKDLPYSTQFIPLAVICTLLKNKIHITNVRSKVKQWYWCGVFGELYGSANETRYVVDVVGVMEWVNDPAAQLPRTVQDAYFAPTRLLTLQTRQSAAYKGIMALVLKNRCQDFISGEEMDFAVYKSANIDIHHIFPANYCETMNYPRKKWNSIVNKTPISYSTNRQIGGVAPSKYLSKIENDGKVDSNVLDRYLNSHWVNAGCCRNDDFNKHIICRAKMLLDAIQSAMGKTITGRDSDEVIAEFGESLK